MKKQKIVLICAAVLLVAAVVVLACGSFSFTTLFSEPTTITDTAEMTEGGYESVDVQYIMDICAVENDADGNPLYYYAVTPVGNAFTVIRFDADEFEDISRLESETLSFLSGDISTMTFHMTVTGTAEKVSTDVYQLFNSWFSQNSEWMSEAGVINALDDYSQYLNTIMIAADTVDGLPSCTAVTLNVVALVLIVLAVALAVLVLAGVFSDKKPAKKAKKPAAKKPAAPAEKKPASVTLEKKPEAEENSAPADEQ